MCGLAEKRASRAVPESNTEEEEVMSKENAGAQGSQLSVAFPLTVAAKGTRNPRRYGYVARMRQQAAERRQSLAVRRQPTEQRAVRDWSRASDGTADFWDFDFGFPIGRKSTRRSSAFGIDTLTCGHA